MLKLINLRKDLIDKELEFDRDKGFKFQYQKLSNKFTDWLFRHYYIQELCENYYDHEFNEYPIGSLDYENARIEFCNWQEPHFKGNWGATQEQVDDMGQCLLKEEIRKNFPCPIKDRLYYAKKDDVVLIYFYGRDLWMIDYWFIFKKRNKNPRRVKRSNSK